MLSSRILRKPAGVVLLVGSMIASAAAGEARIPEIHKQADAGEVAADRILVKLSGASARAATEAGLELPGVTRLDLLPSASPARDAAARAGQGSAWFVAALAAGEEPRQAAARLAGQPGVLFAEPDFVVHALDDEAHETAVDPLIGQQYALTRIQAAQAWAVNRGSRSVVVAVIDTGAQLDHPDLRSQMWTNPRETANGRDDDGNGLIDDVRGWNFVSNTSDPSDDNRHGTHCAGIIAATRDNGVGIAGAADVTIMPVKVLDASGSGYTSDVVRGINYAVANGAKVISMSLGGGGFVQAAADACAAAVAADVVVVAAAGNDGTNQISYPGAYPGVMSVAATDGNDQLASFSNYGNGLAISAPGVQILSTVPGSGFDYLSGTSMATPCVAGIAGLLRSAFPSMRGTDVVARLKATADDLGQPGYDTTFGAGRVNAYRALTNSTNPANPSQPPADDSLEENDDAAHAKPISAGTLNLKGNDADWFTLNVAARSTLTVRVDGPAGDLDLFLHDSSGTLLAQSISLTSHESVEAVVAAGNYFVSVSPYQAKTSEYTLTTQVVAAPLPPVVTPPTTPTPPTPIDPPPSCSGSMCGAGPCMPLMAAVIGLVGFGSRRRIRRRG